jgi:RimJ/RimL family protein N-acetyltransferase
LYPDYWGRGYGTEAVKIALNWLKERGYGYVHTTVLKTNTRSLRLLEKLGFAVACDAREGELWLTRTL